MPILHIIIAYRLGSWDVEGIIGHRSTCLCCFPKRATTGNGKDQPVSVSLLVLIHHFVSVRMSIINLI